MTQQEKELFEKMKEQIQMMEADLQQLMAPPSQLATVLELLPDNLVLLSGPVIVLMPERREVLKKLKVGVQVLVNGAGAIIDVISVVLPGTEATVRRVFADSPQMEIEAGGLGAMLIHKGLVEDCVKPGDTVQVDRTGSIALKIIPKDNKAYSIETATGVTWADIGGQDEAKQALQEAISGPTKHASLWKGYNKRRIKGALLWGPPGCGKTLVAKAAANAIREAHCASDDNTAFIYVKGPEVLNMWVGNTEASIRGLFKRAKEHHEEHGYPAVLFIDEADAILGKRGTGHSSILSSTIVPTFLAEMDGMSDSGAFVLLATNRPDTLDPAVVRDGRIDKKVGVHRPQLRDSAQILKIHLSKTKVQDDINELAGTAAADLYSDDHLFYQVGLDRKGVHQFYFRNLVSGAMLAGIVDAATSLAIERDVAAGARKASGLVKDDMVLAVRQIVKSNRGLDHTDELRLFADGLGGEIATVQRLAA